eukprot:Awhi_evm1s13910
MIEESSTSFFSRKTSSFEDLISAIKENKTGSDLELNNFSIVEEQGAKIGIALKTNTTLKSLNLEMNSLGCAGVKELCLALKTNTTSLTHLNLSNNGIKFAGAKMIGLALQENKTLISLDLGMNDLEGEGLNEISKALRVNKALTSLQLSSCGIRSMTDGLSSALKVNTTLKRLVLDCNNIDYKGIEKIAQALTINNSLQEIDFSCNQIGSLGTRHLALALVGNNTITTMNLLYNDIDKEGVDAIIPTLKVNNILTTIHLYHCPPFENPPEIMQLVEKNISGLKAMYAQKKFSLKDLYFLNRCDKDILLLPSDTHYNIYQVPNISFSSCPTSSSSAKSLTNPEQRINNLVRKGKYEMVNLILRALVSKNIDSVFWSLNSDILWKIARYIPLEELFPYLLSARSAFEAVNVTMT